MLLETRGGIGDGMTVQKEDSHRNKRLKEKVEHKGKTNW